MYRARTWLMIVFLLLAIVPMRTVAAEDCNDHDAAATEAYQRAVLQAQGQVMVAGVTLDLDAYDRAVLQAQGQGMVPATTVASVDTMVAADTYQRATIQAQGQVFFQTSAGSCSTFE